MFLQVAMMPHGNKGTPQLSSNPKGKAYHLALKFPSLLPPHKLTHWVHPLFNKKKIFSLFVKGPLHTRAKSRDQEIVRAQKKVSKGHPKASPKSWIVVTDLQV